MSSEIRANTLKNRVGLSTINITDTGIVVSGVATATTFSGNLSGGTVSGTTGTFSGNLSVAQNIVHIDDTDTKIEFLNNNICFDTAGGERVRIKSDGKIGIGIDNPSSLLHVSGSSTPTILNKSTDASPALFVGDSNRTGAGQHLAEFRGNWNGTNVARIVFHAGDDTTNKDNGEITFRTAAAGSTTEALRIDSSGRLHIATGGSTTNTSGNADDIIIGNTSTSNETGITLFSTSASSIRFSDASGTDSAIEYSHNNRWLNFSSANANKMRITSYNGGSNPKVSVGALANSAFINNSTDGDRSTLKVGNYLHLDSGGNGNFTAGMSYNCWPQGQQNFYQGTVTASGGDNRAAAVLMRYGGIEFWNDNSTTGYTAAQQITTMQKNMTVHAAGYVTTPYQPAFKIGIMSQNSPNSGVVSENNGFTLKDGSSGDTFRDAFNTGDHFDQATGKFTAPVTGVYYFHFSVMRANTAGSGSMDLRIKKNTGLMLARSYRANYSTEGNFASMNVTTITSMTAGHYIEFILGASMSVYEDDSYMLGYLIG